MDMKKYLPHVAFLLAGVILAPSIRKLPLFDKLPSV